MRDILHEEPDGAGCWLAGLPALRGATVHCVLCKTLMCDREDEQAEYDTK